MHVIILIKYLLSYYETKTPCCIHFDFHYEKKDNEALLTVFHGLVSVVDRKGEREAEDDNFIFRILDHFLSNLLAFHWCSL